jgi:hypothetical protein
LREEGREVTHDGVNTKSVNVIRKGEGGSDGSIIKRGRGGIIGSGRRKDVSRGDDVFVGREVI